PVNVKDAASRPATFFKYVHDNIYLASAPQGGMCTVAHSAGATAVAYTLAWYDGGSYLDKASLMAGPVTGDISAGCQVPRVPPTTVCPDGQFGCNGSPFGDAPQYKSGSENAPGEWTGLACNDETN